MQPKFHKKRVHQVSKFHGKILVYLWDEVVWACRFSVCDLMESTFKMILGGDRVQRWRRKRLCVVELILNTLFPALRTGLLLSKLQHLSMCSPYPLCLLCWSGCATIFVFEHCWRPPPLFRAAGPEPWVFGRFPLVQLDLLPVLAFNLCRTISAELCSHFCVSFAQGPQGKRSSNVIQTFPLRAFCWGPSKISSPSWIPVKMAGSQRPKCCSNSMKNGPLELVPVNAVSNDVCRIVT